MSGRPTMAALAALHGTDKGCQRTSEGADFHGQRYVEMYERWAASRRDEPVSILEIGVHSGGSLRMWADYFPNAHIVGIDTAPMPTSQLIDAYNSRVMAFYINQRDAPTLRALADKFGPFDLVIDDGCHEPDAQLGSLDTLWRYVKPGGWYAIEDTHDLLTVANGVRGYAAAVDYVALRLFPSGNPDHQWWLVVMERLP